MITAQDASHLAAIGQEAAQQIDQIESQIKANVSARRLDVPAPPHLIPRIQEFLTYKGFAVSMVNPTMLSISW